MKNIVLGRVMTSDFVIKTVDGVDIAWITLTFNVASLSIKRVLKIFRIKTRRTKDASDGDEKEGIKGNAFKHVEFYVLV